MDRGQLRLRLWPGADVGKPRPLDAVGEMADKPSSRGSAPTGGDAAPPPHSHRPWRVEGARPVPPATPAPPPPHKRRSLWLVLGLLLGLNWFIALATESSG